MSMRYAGGIIQSSIARRIVAPQLLKSRMLASASTLVTSYTEIKVPSRSLSGKSVKSQLGLSKSATERRLFGQLHHAVSVAGQRRSFATFKTSRSEVRTKEASQQFLGLFSSQNCTPAQADALMRQYVGDPEQADHPISLDVVCNWLAKRRAIAEWSANPVPIKELGLFILHMLQDENVVKSLSRFHTCILLVQAWELGYRHPKVDEILFAYVKTWGTMSLWDFSKVIKAMNVRDKHDHALIDRAIDMVLPQIPSEEKLAPLINSYFAVVRAKVNSIEHVTLGFSRLMPFAEAVDKRIKELTASGQKIVGIQAEMMEKIKKGMKSLTGLPEEEDRQPNPNPPKKVAPRKTE